MPHRYPFHTSPKSHGSGIVTVVCSVSVVTYLAYSAFKRGERKRNQMTKDYKPLQPDSLIPSKIVSVDEDRLRRAILEGDSYVTEHLDRRGAFVRFALAHSAGIRDVQGYVMYLEALYTKLFNG
mmetsp:Transcript_20390/g.38188  ORF Transcript_20390/g.38188 Transcript_20390/m.38188 type:complete len:124 (-) Transcript_20390:2227-2598(-)